MGPGPNHARLLAAASRDAIPLEVSLEITHRCNYRCRHCYIPDLSAPDGLSTARILRLLDELAALGALFLTVTGGEPLVRRDWLTIARAARERGFKLRIFSNASLIGDAEADAIRDLPAVVEVSLHSLDPAVFARVTGRPTGLARTLRAIERLRQRDVEVLLKVPVMILNHDGVDAVFAYARSIGADCRADHAITARKDGDLAPRRLNLPATRLLPFLQGPSSSCAPPAAGRRPADDVPLCAAASRFVNITAAGDVLACNLMPRSAGNLRERSFREIWTDSPWLAEIRALRRRHLSVCGDCPRLAYCARCHARALVEDGDLRGPQRSACDHAAALERAFPDSA